MSAHGTQDSSEDVNDFLRRIRELGEKNDEEDAGTRKLEDEILEGRREREARRAGARYRLLLRSCVDLRF